MIRTPLYAPLPPARAAAPVDADAPADAVAEPARETARDGYLAKIVKYVPAEVLSVFVALAAAASAVGREMVLGVFFVGLIATPAYFLVGSAKLPDHDKPRFYFYILAILAFVVWAFGVSEAVRTVFAMDAQVAEILLGLAALLIPLADELLTMLFSPRADEAAV